MPAKIRVLCVDDHHLLREGIAAALLGEEDIELVAEATTRQEAIDRFKVHRPGVTLMVLLMPGMNAIEAIQSIRREFPTARFIVLTGPRITREEVAVYTVKNDKITREQFFYDGEH